MTPGGDAKNVDICEQEKKKNQDPDDEPPNKRRKISQKATS